MKNYIDIPDIPRNFITWKISFLILEILKNISNNDFYKEYDIIIFSYINA